MLDSASFDLWNPGTTTINGALFSLEAELGLYKSYTTNWLFDEYNVWDFTLTLPKSD
jgi:hypothetical protein